MRSKALYALKAQLEGLQETVSGLSGGLQGPKGDQGERGLPGNDGAQGIQGVQGPPGNDGAPGADGADGSQGIQGPPGADGSPGAKGDTGDPGPAPAGTGLVSVTNGILDTPAILPANVVTAINNSHENSRANGAPVYAALSNDTLAQNFAVNSVTKLTVTANRTLTTTIPPAGCQAHIIIVTSGTSSFTITFGSGFKPTTTLATGTTSGRVFVVHWISNGTVLYESGRTAAMVA